MRCNQDEFAVQQHAPALALFLPLAHAQILRFHDQYLPRPHSNGSIHDPPHVIQGLHTAVCDTVVKLVMLEYYWSITGVPTTGVLYY